VTYLEAERAGRKGGAGAATASSVAGSKCRRRKEERGQHHRGDCSRLPRAAWRRKNIAGISGKKKRRGKSRMAQHHRLHSTRNRRRAQQTSRICAQEVKPLIDVVMANAHRAMATTLRAGLPLFMPRRARVSGKRC